MSLEGRRCLESLEAEILADAATAQQIQQQAAQAEQAQGTGQANFANMVNKAGGAEATQRADKIQGMDIVQQAQGRVERMNKVRA